MPKLRTGTHGPSCCLAALLALLGCAGQAASRPPYVPEALRGGLGRIGVVSVRVAPDRIDELPGRGEAMLEGALEGAMEALAAGADGGLVGAALGVVLMPFGATRGAVRGGRNALPAEEIERAERGIERAILAARAEPSLAERVLAYARDTVGERIAPRLEPEAAVDTRLEIGDAIVVLEGAGFAEPDPTLRLRVETRVRLVRVSDGAELLSFVRDWGAGEWHELGTWAEQDGRRVREALDWIQDLLAEKIVEHVLLVYHDPRTEEPRERARRVTSGERLADFPDLPPGERVLWGLAPIQPPSGETPVTVDSLRPIFVWEPFPGRIEIPAGAPGGAATVVPFVPVDLERVDDVSYEIQIRGDDGVVYRRRGIPNARHELPRPLQPSSTYRWALRAWFTLDGEPRVSEWSRWLERGSDGTIHASDWRGFYFETPD